MGLLVTNVRHAPVIQGDSDLTGLIQLADAVESIDGEEIAFVHLTRRSTSEWK